MTDRIIVITSTEECPHFIPDSTRIRGGVEEMYAECALVSSMECETHSTLRGDGACKCDDPFPEKCPLDKRDEECDHSNWSITACNDKHCLDCGKVIERDVEEDDEI